MKKQLINKTGFKWLAIVLVLVFGFVGFVGCGGNNLAQIEEPTEEILPTEEPTEEVIPTETPTEVVTPTEEPTIVVTPTEDVYNFPPIMGKYSVSGLDPNYNNYEGELEIAPSKGYLIWNWSDRARDGVAIPQENVVTVAYLEGEGMSPCNVMSFAIQEDGSLIGNYTVPIQGLEFGLINAQPAGGMGQGIEGTYDFVGSSPGYTNRGPLVITRNGDVYDLYWELDWQEYGVGKWYGVGIQQGNILSVAYSKRKTAACMVFSYLMEEDGTLDGSWVYINSTELGTDIAIPKTSE